MALLFSAATANAQDGGDWTMQFNPYLWGTGLSGSMAPTEIGNVAFTLGGDYIIARFPCGEVRLAGALRSWNVETDLCFSGGTEGEPAGRASNDWVDVLAGVNWQAKTGAKTFATGWAIVGAGGSNLSTDVFAGLDYRINEQNAIVSGYRHPHVDRQD